MAKPGKCGSRTWLDIEGTAYRVENSPAYPISAEVGIQISDVVDELGESPAAFYWDDLLLQTDKMGRPGIHRLRWPKPEPLLYSQVPTVSRVAVRRDRMETLYREGAISGLGDIRSAVKALLKDPSNRFHYLPRAFRFVGSAGSWLYRAVDGLFPPPPGKAASVAVVISFRDCVDLTCRAVESLSRQRFEEPMELVLVNNQSARESVEKVLTFAREKLGQRAQVVPLDYDAPYNHSEQCNLAVRKSRGEVLIMLNNDAELLAPDTIRRLADWAVSPGVATVGPRVIGNGGRLVSSGMSVFSAGSDEIQGGFGIKESAVAPLSEVVRLSVGNSFACAAVSRRVWEELGGLDGKEFPSQFNDADFCLRAIRAGYGHVYLGGEEVFHQPGASGGKPKDVIRETRRRLAARHPGLSKLRSLTPQLERPECKYYFTQRAAKWTVYSLKAFSRLSLAAPSTALLADTASSLAVATWERFQERR